MRAGTFKFIEGESGLKYDIYRDTALDGKQWYRVDVIEKNNYSPEGVRRYGYGWFFKRKIGAVCHIMQREAELAYFGTPKNERKPYKHYLDATTEMFLSKGYIKA